MEIGWICYGFSGAVANFVVWISLFFPVSFIVTVYETNIGPLAGIEPVALRFQYSALTS